MTDMPYHTVSTSRSHKHNHKHRALEIRNSHHHAQKIIITSSWWKRHQSVSLFPIIPMHYRHLNKKTDLIQTDTDTDKSSLPPLIPSCNSMKTEKKKKTPHPVLAYRKDKDSSNSSLLFGSPPFLTHPTAFPFPVRTHARTHARKQAPVLPTKMGSVIFLLPLERTETRALLAAVPASDGETTNQASNPATSQGRKEVNSR